MKRLLLPCLLFFLLFSCRKYHDHPDKPGNAPEPPPPPKLRLKTIGANTYEYDSLGRISKVLYGNAFVASTNYTYTKTSVTAIDIDKEGIPRTSNVTTYNLASNGLATDYRNIIDQGLPVQILNFTFNTERQLVEQVGGDEGKAPTLRTVYYYGKGNMDSSKTYVLPDNKLVQQERFEYYTDRKNTLTNEVNGISWLGAGNVNLLKKQTRINFAATTAIEYTYEFDGQGRAVKSHVLTGGSPFSDLSYTYVEIP